MAHYRKMTINDQTYQFNIGKSYVVIRTGDDKQVVSKDEIGFTAQNGNVIVTPRMIRDHIVDQVGPAERYFEQCCEQCPSSEKKLKADPFDIEVFERITYLLYCDSCYRERQFDV